MPRGDSESAGTLNMSRGPFVALALAGLASTAAADASRAVTFMRQAIGFGDAQIASVEAGEVVTRQLPVADKGEVAAFGAVRVRGDRAAFLRQVGSDVGRARKSGVLEIGRLSRPPRLEDLAGLTLDEDTLAAVRDCKPGDCRIKLSRSAMEKLQREVDAKAADARSRATPVLKEMVVDYTSAYMRGGTAAMATYADKESPIDTSAEFGRILTTSPYLVEYVPELHRYAEEYPRASLAGAEDLFYWSKDKYAPKPTIALFHVVLWNDPGRDVAVIATKRIYSSHYFRAGVELLVVVAAPDGGFYLIDLYRARIDPPTGLLAGTIMGKVRGGIERAVRENLRGLASSASQ
jgi:hypothetical protein